MSALIPINFRGGTMQAVREGDSVLVAVRPVCDAIGIDPDGQQQRLQRQPWATTCMTQVVAQDGKLREMLTVDRRTFTMWLATIDTSRLRSEDARNTLTIFQREAADALDAYFHEGAAVNARAAEAAEHRTNASIFQSRARIELLQAARGLIHPDHLEAHARCVLAIGLGEHAELPADTRPLYTQDYLREKGLTGSRIRSVAGMFGKRVKAAYTEEHGAPPAKYPLQLGNGQVRDVLAYTEQDRPLLDAVYNRYYSEVSA